MLEFATIQTVPAPPNDIDSDLGHRHLRRLRSGVESDPEGGRHRHAPDLVRIVALPEREQDVAAPHV